jgi:hypothetical protein
MTLAYLTNYCPLLRIWRRCRGACDLCPVLPTLLCWEFSCTALSSATIMAPMRNYRRSMPSAAMLIARGALPSLGAPPRHLHQFPRGLECHPTETKLSCIPPTTSSRCGGAHDMPSCISPALRLYRNIKVGELEVG